MTADATRVAAARLGDISAFITKGATPTTYGFEWQSIGVPFLRSECVSENGLDMQQSMLISPAANRALRRSQVSDGDILMTITGYVGRVIRLAGVDSANINQHIARIRIVHRDFNASYVYHWLSQGRTREYYESIITGQAYPQISLAQVRATRIPAVPLRRQQAIAEALDSADDFIRATELMIAKKQAVMQGIMQQLLTGRMRLPAFGGPWYEMKLGDLARFSKGAGLPKSGLSPDGRLPCVHYGELFTAYGPEIESVASRASPNGRVVLSEKLDVLMPTSDVTPKGLAKASSVHDEGVVLGGDILIIRPDQRDAYGPFVAYSIRRDAGQVLRLVRGSTVFHLYAVDMKTFSLSLPSVDEQRAITGILRDTDRDIANARERLAKARNIKVGMMQNLLGENPS